MALGHTTGLPISRSIGKVANGVRSEKRLRLRARSGQTGTVVRKGDRWHGRFYQDIFESGVRIRVKQASVPIVPAVGEEKLTKSEAKNRLQEYLQKIGINKVVYLTKGLEPVKTFDDVTEWWKKNALPFQKPSSRDSVGAILKKHLLPTFGSLPINEIGETTVQEWIAGLHAAGELKPKTIHNIWKVLRLILGAKHFAGWKPKLPSIGKRNQRWFTEEEVSKIIEAAEGQFKILFELQFEMGARFGEMAALQVEDLDFTNSIVKVNKSVYKQEVTTPKTEAGYRDVPVSSEVMERVKAYLDGRTAGRVFNGKRGTPLVHANVNRYVLEPICEELKIPRGTTHAFRHGRISQLQQNRVPGDLIKEWVGHTSLKVTSGYSHFDEKYARKIVEELKKGKRSCSQSLPN